MEWDNRRAIGKALAGEEIGFRMLFERYHGQLVRYVSRFGGLDRQEVLDIVQDSFVRVFQRLANVNEPDKLFQILRITARNRAFTYLQKRKRRSDILEDLWAHMKLVEREGELGHAKALQVVTQLIETLPPGDIRTTVEEYYLGEGVTTEQLAEKLGVPKGTITARLKRFRDDVKRKLAAGLIEVEYDL